MDAIKSDVTPQREFYLDSFLLTVYKERLSQNWANGQREEEAVKNS